MKKFKKIIIWSMLSIMLQVSVLLYLDKVFFKFSSDFVVVSNEAKEDKIVNTEIDYSIPENATDVKFSDDARYIAYTSYEGGVKVVNTSNLSESDLKTEDNGEILYYEWILDEDILIIAEKVYVNSWNTNIKISTINIKNDNFQSEMGESLCTYKEGMTVDMIASSNGTGTYYVGIGGYSSSIYRISINYSVSTVGYYLSSIGNMKAVEDYDILVYEDDVNKTFYYYNNGTSNKMYFENSNNITLIGVDNKKNVYVGEIEDDKISKIIYGKYDTEPSTWSTINLEKPKDNKDIFITVDNEVLINDNLSGVITNLNTSKQIKYEGVLQEVTSQYIISYLDDKIIITSLEEVDNKSE